VSEYIPNAKARAEPGTVQLGTPLTHQRFLRRSNGSYGPRAVAGSGKSLPGHKTPLDGLWLCGDYTFPGTRRLFLGEGKLLKRLTAFSLCAVVRGVSVPDCLKLVSFCTMKCLACCSRAWIR